ncbi:2'-5' RNA ligase superfamily protein [Diaminobutyricimonas aerilata]|uniref:2'-5' RNA ligase superfamily protein n=1 Tax=Diaminobutyricimonas aerilata TaxID=1162967 RepID=A0A2M9CIY1_9MICO|nr:2'-5' RNA ligase family protein [Diaminobutyricimonas aerilata]PJJ71840.1 2'-5' RNA ligase superfamily protein [Diaminobutyricimonas aerilata]
MQSVELLLDADADEAVREEWRELDEAGLPSLARHTGASNRPHITLLVAPEGAETRIASLRDAAALLPVPVTLGGLLLFPSRHGAVLARAVVVTAALLTVHRAVHDAVGRAVTALPVSVPDAWTPHVTLARRLTPAQVAVALEVLEAPVLAATATESRLWDSATRLVHPLGPGQPSR